MSILERIWVTRGYELDQDGLIPPHLLLSYMEHLRWESLSADSKVQIRRLFDTGYHFVVAAQRLQVEQDPGLGVELWADMTVGHVGRSSLEFRHHFRRGSRQGSDVARGSVTAVLLDAAGRPTPVPDDVRREVTEHASERWIDGVELDPPEPPVVAAAGAWRRSLEVRPSDLDLLRHVNHATYLAYVDDTRRLCAAAGGYGEQLTSGRIRQASLDYLQQALQGERLVALTWIVEHDPPTLAFLLQREVDGQVVCRAAVRLGDAALPPAFFAVG